MKADGSDTSNGHDFIRALDPEVAVISSKYTRGDSIPRMVTVQQAGYERCPGLHHR